jgi:hypothetical protein
MVPRPTAPHPPGFVPGTRVYQVKCPAGTTEVTLTMSQDLGNGCPPTPGSDIAHRSITPVPVVTVTPPEGPAVCADAGSKILDFGVSSDQGGPIRIQSLTPGICTSNVQVGEGVRLGCTAADGSQSWAFSGSRSRERAHLPHLVAESAVQRVVQSKRAEGRGTRSWQDQCRLLHTAPTPCRLKHASHHMNAPNSVYTRDSES